MRLISCLLMFAVLGPLAASAHPLTPPAKPSQVLIISGGVERRLALEASALKNRPAAQVHALDLPVKGGGVSAVRGVRLKDLLDEAGIRAPDHNTVKKLAIIAGATDGYKVVFSWNELYNSPLGEKVLVLFERDGKPLGADEGPLALVSATDSRIGPRHVKWLQEVEVRQVAE